MTETRSGLESVVFAREIFNPPLFDEMWPLIREHYVELAPEGAKCEPVTEAYDALQTAGFLRVYTARTDCRLVGYAFHTVVRNPQYANALHAKQDLIFLAEEYRGASGARFLRWCDEQLQREGVEFSYRHHNVKKDFGKLLNLLGYHPHEKVYLRRLNSCARG